MSTQGIFLRIVLSAVVLFVAGWFTVGVEAVQMLGLGSLAGSQLDNSASSYLAFKADSQWLRSLAVVGPLTFVALMAIWWTPLRRLLAGAAVIGATAIALLLPSSPPAFAFAETTDRTEIVNIQPNESAFWIPNVGANKDTQAQFESESYLQANKVATKWFEIPHVKLAGSSGKSWTSGWDLYVPTGRMIIVPRQPYSHEWVDATDRGSSNRREGFPCQDNQGLDFGVGVSIAAVVTEDQAARFLYNFGVVTNQGAKRDDPQVTFQSVYSARSLYDVMQDNGRKRVQTLICDQIMQHDIDWDNAHLVEIMNTVREQAAKYFSDVGITLRFIGYADTAHFDDAVQAAINRRYIAKQDQAAAAMLEPYRETIQALAQAEALRGWGARADGKLPTTVVGVPPSLLELLKTLGTTPPAAAAVPAAPTAPGR